METVKKPIKNISEFIDTLLFENHRIFGSTLTNEKVANFYFYYRDAIKKEAIDALQEGAEEITVWYGPVKGRIEPKISYALIASGISANGTIPNGEEYCYQEFVFPKNKIEDFLIREHEIITAIATASKINKLLQNKEQSENSPSYVEIADLLIKANNIKACNKPVPEEFKEDFKIVKPIFEENLDSIFQISLKNLQNNPNYKSMITPHILEYCHKNKPLQYIDMASIEFLRQIIDIEEHIYHLDKPIIYKKDEGCSRLITMINATSCLGIVLDGYICPVLSAELNDSKKEENEYSLKYNK